MPVHPFILEQTKTGVAVTICWQIYYIESSSSPLSYFTFSEN